MGRRHALPWSGIDELQCGVALGDGSKFEGEVASRADCVVACLERSVPDLLDDGRTALWRDHLPVEAGGGVACQDQFDRVADIDREALAIVGLLQSEAVAGGACAGAPHGHGDRQ